MLKFTLTCISLLLALSSFSQNQKVLIIGIDGCRSDAQIAANTPNLDALISSGVYSPDAMNTDITISGPGWSANLCGVWSDKHQVTGNSFSGSNYDEYPSIFRRIEEFNPELYTVSISHWNPINNQIIQDDADYTFNASSDEQVRDVAQTVLIDSNPDVMFLHFDDIDIAGHSHGFSIEVPQYLQQIDVVDALIGEVIETLESRPNYATEDWLILITTDHGGNGTSHGGNSFGEQNVFVIASAQNVEPNVIERDSSYVLDNPENCLADSVALFFDGADDFVQIANSPVFNFGSDQDFTIECRVRTNIAADVAIVGNKDWDTGNNPGFVFSFQFPNGPNWKMNIGDVNGNRLDMNAGGEIADNEWHTLSVSFDRDGAARLYTDGQFVQSADMSFIGDINSGESLFFGADVDGGYDFTGEIAEVRVWNEVISADEIANWYCSSVDQAHPSSSNLIGHWKLNEGGNSNIVLDYSVGNNLGVIVGAEWNSVTDSVLVYNYENTPRIVDIPVTALAHMCIPIQEAWDLDGNSLVPLCNSEIGVLNGVVDWNPDCGPSEMTIIFCNPLTDNVIYTANTLIDSDGTYSIENSPFGIFDIYVKVPNGLQEAYLEVEIEPDSNTLNISAFNLGDINDDNAVNIIDVSIMNTSFGLVDGADGYNPLADLNCDGGVSIIDVSFVNSIFGMEGASP